MRRQTIVRRIEASYRCPSLRFLADLRCLFALCNHYSY